MGSADAVRRLMLPPDAWKRLVWDGATLALAILSSVASPLLMAWSPAHCYLPAVWAELLLDAWFCATIVVNMRTGVVLGTHAQPL